MDRLGAEVALDPLDLASHQFDGLLPAHPHPLVGAALLGPGGRAVLLPYRAGGVTGALLPAFRPDSVMIDGAPEPMLLALSAQALTSDGAFSMVLPPKS